MTTSSASGGCSVPSLSLIVDQLTARKEWAESEGLTEEAQSLTIARETILDHVFREERNRSIIRLILSRIRLRAAA